MTGVDLTATSRELLDAAGALLDDHGEVAAGLWPRAVALLARQSLEQAVEDLWEAQALDMRDVSTRAQFLCLGTYLDEPELGEDACFAWWALSRACHLHPYELAPTAGELRAWLGAVERLVTNLDVRSAAGPDERGS